MPDKDAEFDVVVVGFGVAGASAAIEAADRGERVLVLDASSGGGASRLSGGIVYAGGGTEFQRQAGYTDTPENLFAYLRQEVGDAVDEATLRRFCDESAGTIPWLEEQGIRFRSDLVPYKTSYPTDRYFLYFSGNEKAYPYNEHADPAPRGHRPVAKGLASGKVLWQHLARSALRKGVVFTPLARVEALEQVDGTVTGLDYRVLERSQPNAKAHARLTRATAKIGNWAPQLVRGVTARIERLWQDGAVSRTVRAPRVILAAGRFIYNTEWVRRYAPGFTKISPLGTPGDDGSGIASDSPREVPSRRWETSPRGDSCRRRARSSRASPSAPMVGESRMRICMAQLTET